MKILVLFVRHGTEKHPDALIHLNDWYARQGLLTSRTLCIIDNALPECTPPATLPDGTILMRGDNHAWEFSAWAHALQSQYFQPAQFEVVHLVTSAFNSLYTGYLEHFHNGMLPELLKRQACLGHIDCYDQPVEFAGRRSAHWIRTCFVFLPFSLANQLDCWTTFTDPSMLFYVPTSFRFRSDAPLSVDYQNRIRGWLEGQEVGGHRWHSPVGTTLEEVARFQQKTMAILNEHSLSADLREKGVPLIDYCWWHTISQGFAVLPASIPSEAEQIKVRRRVLGIPEAPG